MIILTLTTKNLIFILRLKPIPLHRPHLSGLVLPYKMYHYNIHFEYDISS